MVPARIHLVRHADAFAGGRLCGWYDAPLSEKGRRQIQALPDRVRRLNPAVAMYTSPLTRAWQTAIVFAEAWDLPGTAHEAWREIGCGVLDGEPIESVKRDYPELWARNLAQNDDTFAWPGGESYRGFRARVLDAMDELAKAYPGARLVVVTHAGVINQVVGTIRGYSAAAWEPNRPDPVTVTTVDWGNGIRALQTFNLPL